MGLPSHVVHSLVLPLPCLRLALPDVALEVLEVARDFLELALDLLELSLHLPILLLDLLVILLLALKGLDCLDIHLTLRDRIVLLGLELGAVHTQPSELILEPLLLL